MKAFACLAIVSSSAVGAPLYSQGPGGTPGFGFYSHDAPKPTRNFKHADNFVLGADAVVESVAWWGMSEQRDHADLANFDTFTVEFYTNQDTPAGRPRPTDLIASFVFGVADTGPTATGRTSPAGSIEFRHEGALAVPLALAAGEYHIAISAGFIDPDSDGWLWQDGAFVDGLSSIYSYSSGRWSSFNDTDSAFELHGAIVPAPGGGLALAMVAVAGRRRARAGSPARGRRLPARSAGFALRAHPRRGQRLRPWRSSP